MKIYVIGSLNIDLTISVAQLPARGMTVHGGRLIVNAGGKGANQAVACAKLGGDVSMAGCVGETFSEELFGALERYGVDARFVEKRENVSSGAAVILVEDGDNRIVLDRGANALVDEELVRRALAGAKAGDLLICQLEIPPKTVAFALRLAKEKGMTTLFNPAPATALPEGLFSDCDFVMPNQSEAEFYTGIYPRDDGSVKACAAAFARMGAENTVITLGGEGSVCASRGGICRAAPFSVETVDTTAAGDTFIGAFAVRLLEGAPIAEAMRFASCASALTVTKRGAQQAIPTRAEAEALLARGESAE